MERDPVADKYIADSLRRIAAARPTEKVLELQNEAMKLDAESNLLRARQRHRAAMRDEKWGWLDAWAPYLLGIVFGIGVAVVVLLLTWPWVRK
jgi:hypothetical protein